MDTVVDYYDPTGAYLPVRYMMTDPVSNYEGDTIPYRGVD